MPRCWTCGQRWEGHHRRCPRGAPPVEAPPAPRERELPELELPGYRLERVVARGGFGTLLAARREEDGVAVALKVAHRHSPLAWASLEHEVEVLRTIGPPTVPQVYESGTLPGGVPYLVMQYIARPTLAERLAHAQGPLPEEEVRWRALALVQALQAVHRLHLLHGDLKPENLFLDDEARGVCLVDFGLAQRTDRPLPPPVRETTSTAGSFAGTAEYMAPEQCAGELDLDARTDLYALGIILYEMLTGRVPFCGPPSEVMQAHLSRRPQRPSELAAVPAALEEVVLRCLTKDRPRRYASAEALRHALEEALARREGPAPPVVQRPPEPKPAASAPMRRSVAVLLLRSSANPLALQRALAGFGGSMAFQEAGRSAGVFDPDVGENPVQRARQAAESLLTQGLVQGVLVDVATVTVQRRPGGPPRYLGSVFARKERWPGEADPALLFSAAAVEALPELPCQPVPGREGLFQRPPTASAREDITILQMGSGVLVGRELQLEDLLAGARSALEGRSPTLATVLCERGQGKTHLCAELALRLRQELPQAQVYAWRAREPVQGDPEGTLRVLLRDSLNAFAAEDTRTADEGRSTFFDLLGLRLGSELWPGVAATLGWLQPGAEGLQSQAAAPGALRSLALRAAGEVLAASARRRPLCILLDDAHHAEETALDALEYAALAESGLPLWVCVLARPGFARTRPAWGSRAAHRHTLQLGPLELEAAVELCRQVLRPAENVPVEALERLAERAQRVPLFIVELVRGLKRLGLVRQRPGGSWYLATDELGRMPELRLVEWLADRELGALPAELAAHARLCALLGTEFSAAEAEGVLHGLEREGHAAEFPLDARHATRRLLDLGLLVAHRHESLSFRNELLRETVVRSLPEPERLRIHRAAYRYFMSERATPGRLRLPRLALHAAAAGLGEEAAALYIDLAESARGRHAYLEAESTYSRALELLPEEDGLRRFTVLRGRGLMRYRVGRYEDSLADFAQARALARQQGRVAEEADLLLDEAMALDWTNDYARSEERALEAHRLAQAHGLDSPLLEARLLLALGRSQFRRSQWSEACATLQAAADRARRLGDAGYESRVVSQILLAAILPNIGRMEDAGRTLEEVIAACTERGDRLHLGSAINNRRNLWVARKDLQSAVREQRMFMQMGRELGMVGWEYVSEFNLGELLYHAGQVQGAGEHIERAMDLEARYGQVASQPIGRLLRARLLVYTGEEEQAREMLAAVRRHLATWAPGGDMGPSGEVLCSLVDLATREAAEEEWQELYARSRQHSVEQEPLEVLELSALAHLRRGHRQQALELLREAQRQAERIPNLMEERLGRSLEQALRAAP